MRPGGEVNEIGTRGAAPSAADIRVDRRRFGCPVERAEVAARATAAMLACEKEGRAC
jgi:hypothetical protein